MFLSFFFLKKLLELCITIFHILIFIGIYLKKKIVVNFLNSFQVHENVNFSYILLIVDDCYHLAANKWPKINIFINLKKLLKIND